MTSGVNNLNQIIKSGSAIDNNIPSESVGIFILIGEIDTSAVEVVKINKYVDNLHFVAFELLQVNKI